MVELIVVAIIAVAVYLIFGKKKPAEVTTAPPPDAGKDIVDLNVVTPTPMPGKIEEELGKWPFPPPPPSVDLEPKSAPVKRAAAVKKPAAKKAAPKKAPAKKVPAPKKGHQLTVHRPPAPKKRPS